MNTAERQELPANELGETVQAVGQRLEKYATPIVVGICAVLAIAAFFAWWSRQASSVAVNAWSLLESAHTIDEYGTVADKYKGSVAARWAKLCESELHLQAGMSIMFSDRELALSDLKRAREGFEQLADEKSEPVMRERVLWGLALCLETTSDGDTTKAIEAYQKLLNEIPETIYKPLAENRVTELKTGGAKEFYAWFAKQNPKPSESRPKDGMMGIDDNTSASDFTPNPPPVKPKTEVAPDKKSDAGAGSAPTDPVKSEAAKSEAAKQDADKSDATKQEEKPATEGTSLPKSEQATPEDSTKK